MRKPSFGALRALLVIGTAICATASFGDGSDNPQYGHWGFDAAAVDSRIKPGDDFFRYANGAWLDKTPIPQDKPGFSLRLQMTDRTEARLHDMMEALAKSSGHSHSTLEGKVGAFYSAFMAEKRVESLGAGAIASELDAIRAANNRSKIAALMGGNNADFYGTLFSTVTDVDLKDPKRYAVYVTQDGLTLPDRDFYLKRDFAAQKAKLQSYATQALKLSGWTDPEGSAKAIVDFQTKV